RILGPPEVGDNPRAQQVVAEITERAGRAVGAAINSIAIARNPPVMPEVRGFHGKEPVTGILAQRKTVPGSNCGIVQATAGCGSEGAVRDTLRWGAASLNDGCETLTVTA